MVPFIECWKILTMVALSFAPEFHKIKNVYQMENLNFRTESANGQNHTKIMLAGHLIKMDAIQFKHYCKEKINSWASDIIIDLRAIQDIDLTGVNSLIKLNLESMRKSKNLSLILNQDSPVIKWLDISNLTSLLPIEYAQS